MYTTINFKTKKALKLALSQGEKLTYFQPGFFSDNPINNGVIYVEGPHYPKPHKWYATCQVKNNLIISIK